jgi:hypothetical protein
LKPCPCSAAAASASAPAPGAVSPAAASCCPVKSAAHFCGSLSTS